MTTEKLIERLNADIEKMPPDWELWPYPLLREAASALTSQSAELAKAKKANSTRPDYDLVCEECGRAHILDTVLPSEIWNQIAEPHNILCTICIDKRLLAKGLKAECEFYFVGGAMESKLYAATELLSLRRKVEEAERERDEARNIVRDIHWMAVRYADNRKSYAVGMCNDALRKAYDAGWLTYTRNNDKLDPQYARDGMFDREWVSALDAANARAESSQHTAEEMRKALADVRSMLDVEYHDDGRIACVGHASDGLRKIVAVLDAARALGEQP